MPEVLRRVPPPRRKQNDWLIKKGYNISSQGGEDGVIAEIFATFDAKPMHHKETRWCVEFGAWDGKHLSNSYNLLHNQPECWSGALIEADADRYVEMKQRYANHTNVDCLNMFVTLDGEQSLDCILLKYCPSLPTHFDMISIDIDGADYHVWEDLKHYHPLVTIIEFNPTIPNNVVFVQERDIRISQGSSLAALIELGKRKGYELVSTTTYNAVFVQNRLYPLFNIGDNSIDVMHDVPIPMEIFQLYDGTLKLTGCKKLIWKKVPIEEERLQVIAPEERFFALAPFEKGRLSDDMTQDKKYFEQCQASSTHDWMHFVKRGHAAISVHSNKDVQELFRLAIKLAPESEMKHAKSIILTAFQDFSKRELSKSCNQAAAEWLHEMLHMDPQCSPIDRAVIFAKLGECYVRMREFDKAEFYLQTSTSIQPAYKPALKSLVRVIRLEKLSHKLMGNGQAKLYTKVNDAKSKSVALAQLQRISQEEE
uniref:Uncharacterized protein AlNc14C1G83 n=1 Tax=Albugo laibachii Nc14 TaxID=890382 RepID=F0VYT1_9STRA|nr:conserved hypothetical protein [Albugo laibachii Nc14]|eukprot:CCA13946.1 conserved hypothetical protein [Albugo laibachii Nc14]